MIIIIMVILAIMIIMIKVMEIFAIMTIMITSADFFSVGQNHPILAQPAGHRRIACLKM